MVTKTLKKAHPFERIQEWALHKVEVFINSTRYAFPDGISLDIEDDEKGGFVGLGISDGYDCYYWTDLKEARKLTLPKFVAHNGISDIRKLQKWGFEIDESWLLWDTQLMAHVIDSSQHSYGLKDLVKRELGCEYPSYEEICGKKTSKNHKTLVDFPAEAVAQYNACDTYYTYQLYLKQTKGQGMYRSLETPALDYFKDVEKPCASVFYDMSSRGTRIDIPYLTELKEHLEDQIQPVEKQIKNDLGDINLNSPKQLLEALNEKQITPTFKGKASTDKRALEYHKDNVIVSRLLYYSELSTLLSNFVTPYLERNTEILHPYFNQCGTRTGRPSCSNPNLLQIPKRTENGKLVRRMFIAREGYTLADVDYGQIEPRLLAHLSKDKAMCAMFNSGIDFHTFTGKRLAISRDRAKVLNLSVGYRATFKSVSAQLKCGEEEAQKQIDAWWSMFPELKNWQEQLIWKCKKDGYFTTLMGRRIKVDNLGEYNKWKREHAERQLINNIAQASAAEVMKKAMVKVAQLEGVYPLVQVYDALLCELEHAELSNDVATCMTNAVKLDVPLTVSTALGTNWSECHGTD